MARKNTQCIENINILITFIILNRKIKPKLNFMQSIEKTKFEMIEKEKISELQFPLSDVLSDEISRKERWAELQRATTLGNLDKIKFKIYFSDHQNKKYYTETTIWGLTNERIILKHGIMIPINRVFYIKY